MSKARNILKIPAREKVMKAKWMAVLAIALLFSGCDSEPKTQPRIEKVGKDVFFLEVEEFGLTNAKVPAVERSSFSRIGAARPGQLSN